MILFADGALADLERILEFNAAFDPRLAQERLDSIRSAIEILERHPRIGRAVENSELRELVISVGKRGFVALYAWDEAAEVIRILGVRHQREAGYRGR